MDLKIAKEKIEEIKRYVDSLHKSQDLSSVVNVGIRLASLRLEMSMAYENALRELPELKRKYRSIRESTAQVKRISGASVSDSEREGRIESMEGELMYEMKDSEAKAWKIYIESLDVAINCVARVQRYLEMEYKHTKHES